jgi:hypothetical protein
MLVFTIVAGAAVLCGLVAVCTVRARRRTREREQLTFEVVDWPGTIVPGEHRQPARDPRFRIVSRFEDPAGYCLRTGKIKKECTCSIHRA